MKKKKNRIMTSCLVLHPECLIEIRERAGLRNQSSEMMSRPITSTFLSGSALGGTSYAAASTRLPGASTWFSCSTSRPK